MSVTAYEVVLINNVTGKRYFVGYTERHTFQSVLRMSNHAYDRLRRVVGKDIEQSKAEGKGKFKAIVFGDWQIRFSGNTRFTCYEKLEELPT